MAFGMNVAVSIGMLIHFDVERRAGCDDCENPLLADETADLLDDLALSRVTAQYQTRDRNCQDEKRSHRKGGVIGERRGHARYSISAPSAEGSLEQTENYGGLRARRCPVVDFDLLGGPSGAGKPYAMLERGSFGRDETIPNEA
jgi:hypothetical protein